jgi:hypothetical protein
MSQTLQERRTGTRGHDAAARAARIALERHQRFNEQSLRHSAHAHRRSMVAQRRLDMESRSKHGGAGFIGTVAGLVILAVVAYAAYSFFASSGLLL